MFELYDEKLKALLTKEAEKLLTEYSKWLEKQGYLDSDWWAEQPNAVEEFLGIRN